MENESGILVQPVYVVCDESSSMTDDGILAVNAGIQELLTVVANDPVVDAKLRLSLVFFDDKAEVVLSLSQCSNVDNVLGCVRSGNPSNFASVFRALKSQIQIDMPRLKSDGFRVSRPIVLLISGSVPTDHDEWGDAYSELIDQNFRFHPNIICLGLEGSNFALSTNVATKTSSNDPLGERFVFKVQDFPSKKEVGEFVSRLFVLAARSGSVIHSDDQKRSINIGSLGEVDGISQFLMSRTSPQENSITRSRSDLSGGVGLLPFYIVCDEGSSMTDEAVTAVNRGIGELFRAIHSDPIVDAKARIGIITFNDQASVLLPLTELSQITQSPGCVRSDNPSSYKNVFSLLNSQIENDVLRLEVEGFRVHRPVVFFMSAGKPKLEEWHSAWEELTEKKSRFRPHIVSWGTPGADPSIISKVATPWFSDKYRFTFLAKDGINPGAAIREIMKFTESDMIYSAR